MNKTGKVSVITVATLSAIGLAVAAQHSARAMDPPHPHYLHALSDLRDARAWIEMSEGASVTGIEGEVVSDIDKAIGEIKRAAIDDGRELKDHMPIDPSVKHRSRLKKAADLLGAARRDLNAKEDNMAALGWRKAALRHVDEADHAVKRAMKELHE